MHALALWLWAALAASDAGQAPDAGFHTAPAEVSVFVCFNSVRALFPSAASLSSPRSLRKGAAVHPAGRWPEGSWSWALKIDPIAH